MRQFEDHFSRVAETYVRSRPTYPDALFTYLASIAPHHRLAWDCGTGNGQAALGLASSFDRIIATDASADQLGHAPLHRRIEYRVARAEEAGIADHSTALVTVAVAVHWFDFDPFYAEVRRVLSPSGAIAVWCYSIPMIEPAIDAIIRAFAHEFLMPYWPERFTYVHERYTTLPFPFEELSPPRFTMTSEWDLATLLGFLKSWSGSASYLKETGKDPLERIVEPLERAWGAGGGRRAVHWTIHMRVGR
jgi:SAM-dependent methyltransferase